MINKRELLTQLLVANAQIAVNAGADRDELAEHINKLNEVVNYDVCNGPGVYDRRGKMACICDVRYIHNCDSGRCAGRNRRP